MDADQLLDSWWFLPFSIILGFASYLTFYTLTGPFFLPPVESPTLIFDLNGPLLAAQSCYPPIIMASSPSFGHFCRFFNTTPSGYAPDQQFPSQASMPLPSARPAPEGTNP